MIQAKYATITPTVAANDGYDRVSEEYDVSLNEECDMLDRAIAQMGSKRFKLVAGPSARNKISIWRVKRELNPMKP